jgi:PAS domain-containing protein
MDEAQVTDLLDHMSDALYAVDKYWCFTYLNHTAAMQLGRNRDDLLGKNIWEEWPHAVGSDAYNHLLGAMEERRAVTFEYISPTLHRAFDVRAHPYAGGLAVYQSDNTARKQAQTESERLFTEL